MRGGGEQKMCVDQKNHFGKKYDIKQIYDKNMTVCVWGGEQKNNMGRRECAICSVLGIFRLLLYLMRIFQMKLFHYFPCWFSKNSSFFFTYFMSNTIYIFVPHNCDNLNVCYSKLYKRYILCESLCAACF